MSSHKAQNLLISPALSVQTLSDILRREGFAETEAAHLAKTFTDNSIDGVYTHGLNRFPRFVDLIRRGHVVPSAKPECTLAAGALEQWDGHLGAGILNACTATERAMVLAQSHGLGCVGLANTNHWMRGGTYGWQAAERGFVFIGWTNTIANLPAWGGCGLSFGEQSVGDGGTSRTGCGCPGYGAIAIFLRCDGVGGRTAAQAFRARGLRYRRAHD